MKRLMTVTAILGRMYRRVDLIYSQLEVYLVSIGEMEKYKFYVIS